MNDEITRHELERLKERCEMESFCHRCGGPNVIWSAPSPLWNFVMRDDDIDGEWKWNEIICPMCFVGLAEQKGVKGNWNFAPNTMTEGLIEVTPTGRVWNSKTWMWEEPV